MMKIFLKKTKNWADSILCTYIRYLDSKKIKLAKFISILFVFICLVSINPIVMPTDLYHAIVDPILANKVPPIRPSAIPLINGLKGLFFIGFIICNYMMFMLVNNITLLILLTMGAMLIELLFLNFRTIRRYDRSMLDVKRIVSYILNNLSKLIILIIKILVISIILRLFTRTFVHTLLVDHSLLSNILVVTLSMPIYYYLLNLALKYIRKEKITSKDYSIYNDYVVSKINLYNISYYIFICVALRYFYTIYISMIIILFFILLIIILYIYNEQFECNYPYNKENMQLQSTTGFSTALVLPIIGLVGCLQEQACEGWREINIHKMKLPRLSFYEMRWKKECAYYGLDSNKSFNIVNKIETNVPNFAPLPEVNPKDQIKELKGSSIVHIAQKQQSLDILKKSNNRFVSRVHSFVINKDFKASVLTLNRMGRASANPDGKYAVITIVKNDCNSDKFLPTVVVHDGTNQYRDVIEKSLVELREKYGIWLRKLEGLIILTQAEPLGPFYGNKDKDKHGLYKLWRPTRHFSDPNFINKNLKDYYKLDYEEEENLDKARRLNQFSILTRLNTHLKEKLLENTLEKHKERITENENKPVPLPDKEIEAQIIHNELDADQVYIQILDKYLRHGWYLFRNSDYSPFQMRNEIIDRRQGMTREDIVSKCKESFEGKKDWYKNIRRKYPLSWIFYNKDEKKATYIHLYRSGVIEGSRDDEVFYTTDLKKQFNVPNRISRRDTIVQIINNHNNFRNIVGLEEIFGVSINRVSFEFFSLKYNSHMPENIEDRYDFYSIIDLNNTHPYGIHQYKLRVGETIESKLNYIHNQIYNWLDVEDDNSIRKIMDYLHKNRGNKLPYLSDVKNSAENTPLIAEGVDDDETGIANPDQILSDVYAYTNFTDYRKKEDELINIIDPSKPPLHGKCRLPPTSPPSESEGDIYSTK